MVFKELMDAVKIIIFPRDCLVIPFTFVTKRVTKKKKVKDEHWMSE